MKWHTREKNLKCNNEKMTFIILTNDQTPPYIMWQDYLKMTLPHNMGQRVRFSNLWVSLNSSNECKMDGKLELVNK